MSLRTAARRTAIVGLAASMIALTLTPLAHASAQPPYPLAFTTISSAAGFLKESQNIASTDYNSLSEIFFFLSARIALDGDLSRVNASMQAFLASRLRALENADGGYGDWVGDRSTAGATARSLECLGLLGLAP